MGKPLAEDAALSKFVLERLYKPTAKFGSGSTADAARHELATLQQVKGKYHIEKCHDSIRFLERWLDKNPTATPGDRAIAENLILDLKDAIGQKPWYSQTKPPKY